MTANEYKEGVLKRFKPYLQYGGCDLSLNLGAQMDVYAAMYLSEKMSTHTKDDILTDEEYRKKNSITSVSGVGIQKI